MNGCIVSTNGSASSLRTALHRLYERLCIVSTNGCIVSMSGSATALQRLYERLYDGSTTAHTVAHTIVGINGSASSLQTVLQQLYKYSTNGPTNGSMAALYRLYERPCIVSTNNSTNGSTNGSAAPQTA